MISRHELGRFLSVPELKINWQSVGFHYGGNGTKIKGNESTQLWSVLFSFVTVPKLKQKINKKISMWSVFVTFVMVPELK